MKEKEEARRRVEAAQNALEKALEYQRLIDSQTPEEVLAIELHDTFCTSNHADQCSWYYEGDPRNGIHEWHKDTHSRYLGVARNTMNRLREKDPNVTYQYALELVQTIGGR